MKITGVETFLVFAEWRNWVFVRVSTDEGLTGCGEATLEGKEQAVVAAIGDQRRGALPVGHRRQSLRPARVQAAGWILLGYYQGLRQRLIRRRPDARRVRPQGGGRRCRRL